MKYIIEIEKKPLCVFDKDTQTYFPRLWRVKGFNSLVFDEDGLSRLEELNSDYINEHFGDLQDTAYQRGLDDAWECMKKIAFLEKPRDMRDFFGCSTLGGVLIDYSASEAIEKLKAYEEKQKADDKIKVRDEVIWMEDENVAIVVTSVYTANNMEWCDGVCKDGKVYHILTENARKTGRRFDIDKILEEMKK